MTRRDDRRRPQGAEALEEMDRRLGGLLGSFGEALGRALEGAEDAEGVREARWTLRRGGVEAETSFRVRFGAAERGAASEARRSEAGRSTTSRAGAGDAEASPTAASRRPGPRETLFDVHDDEDLWTLTVDLPGVEESELRIDLVEGELGVQTVGPRRHAVRVPAPDGARLETMSRRFSNGVLELSWRRPAASDSASEGSA